MASCTCHFRDRELFCIFPMGLGETGSWEIEGGAESGERGNGEGGRLGKVSGRKRVSDRYCKSKCSYNGRLGYIKA